MTQTYFSHTTNTSYYTMQSALSATGETNKQDDLDQSNMVQLHVDLAISFKVIN